MKDDIYALIQSIGVAGDIDNLDPEWFAVDFNNAILGDPYLEGTGWLPDKNTAIGVANIILPILNAHAVHELELHPELGGGYTDPEGEAERSWCYLISAKRDANDEPAVEEQYEGDVWFTASVELGILCPEQQEMLDKVRTAVARAWT